jgi:hypothetical protein
MLRLKESKKKLFKEQKILAVWINGPISKGEETLLLRLI